MESLMLNVVENYGYLGIFMLIFIENVFPPIPSEAVLLFGGALTVSTALNAPGMIIAATIGSVAGAVVLYALGRIFKAERLRKLFEGKFGQVLHLNPEHVDKSVEWFEKYESKAVLICRCVPIVRSLISIPAGFASMNIPKFLILTTLGSAVWNTVLVYIGSMLGEAWEKAMPYFDKYSSIAAVVIFVAVCLAAVYFLVIKKKNKNK